MLLNDATLSYSQVTGSRRPRAFPHLLIEGNNIILSLWSILLTIVITVDNNGVRSYIKCYKTDMTKQIYKFSFQNNFTLDRLKGIMLDDLVLIFGPVCVLEL